MKNPKGKGLVTLQLDPDLANFVGRLLDCITSTATEAYPDVWLVSGKAKAVGTVLHIQDSTFHEDNMLFSRNDPDGDMLPDLVSAIRNLAS